MDDSVRNMRKNTTETMKNINEILKLISVMEKRGELLEKEVHHILPLSRGGTNNEDNLMSLCKSCHSKIHAKSGDRFGG